MVHFGCYNLSADGGGRLKLSNVNPGGAFYHRGRWHQVVTEPEPGVNLLLMAEGVYRRSKYWMV